MRGEGSERDDELLPELIKSVLPLEARDPKHYNGQKIPREAIEELMEILRLAPSSVNSQPWKFFLISSDESKKQFAETVLDFNKERVLLASDVIVFAVPEKISEEHLQKLLNNKGYKIELGGIEKAYICTLEYNEAREEYWYPLYYAEWFVKMYRYRELVAKALEQESSTFTEDDLNIYLQGEWMSEIQDGD